MERLNSIAILVVCAVALLFIATLQPDYLSDENQFLKGFVGSDFISFMGVVMTLSVGLLAQLFLNVGKLREKLPDESIKEIYGEIRNTAHHIVCSFFTSCLIVFLKSLSSEEIAYIIGLNILSLLLILYYGLILYDVVMSIFDFDI